MDNLKKIGHCGENWTIWTKWKDKDLTKCQVGQIEQRFDKMAKLDKMGKVRQNGQQYSEMTIKKHLKKG